MKHHMRITFIYKFLRSHTNCFMERMSPIFSDYKLVKIMINMLVDFRQDMYITIW